MTDPSIEQLMNALNGLKIGQPLVLNKPWNMTNALVGPAPVPQGHLVLTLQRVSFATFAFDMHTPGPVEVAAAVAFAFAKVGTSR